MLASILVSPSPSICAFALVDSHINFNDASTQAHWLDWMCGAIVVLKLAIAQCVWACVRIAQHCILCCSQTSCYFLPFSFFAEKSLQAETKQKTSSLYPIFENIFGIIKKTYLSDTWKIF